MNHYVKNYPRPQLVRENWELLDGSWNFAFDDERRGEREQWQSGADTNHFPLTIQVPFTYETKMSGIGDETAHKVVWYERTIQVTTPEDAPKNKQGNKLANKRLLLHFEGVDFYTKVWVNGQLAGTHRGGYARFSMDITDLVQEGENRLTVRVEDSFDTSQPRGKQRWKDENFGCWYVQTTGIWKSVWMEYVAAQHIEHLKITPNLVEKQVVIEAGITSDREDDSLILSARVLFNGQQIREAFSQVVCGNSRLVIDLNREDLYEWGVKTWCPEHPDLYEVELELLKGAEGAGDAVMEYTVSDQVDSYFGLRDIRIEGDKILLNGGPLYQRLILDQGYWEESHLTPPSEEALIRDIDAILAMGYNGLRKHQKTEDERFLYWCDVKGVLVWSEAPAAYHYSDGAVEEFTREWMEIVRQNYSHPCIITWTPFNESWGVGEVKNRRDQQHFTEAIYHLTKSFDPIRPVIVNDGWEHTVSDILTLHDYEELGDILYRRYAGQKDGILAGTVFHCGDHSAFANGYAYRGQPVIISEFGGIAFNEEGGWGYGNKVADKEAFIKRFDSITTAIKKLPYVCGYCYTQISDVQQEINGLMDAKRNHKIEPEILKEINVRRVEPQ